MYGPGLGRDMGTVFSPNAQFYVYLTFGSPHARFISLFMMFVDRRHPKVKLGHKKWRVWKDRQAARIGRELWPQRTSTQKMKTFQVMEHFANV